MDEIRIKAKWDYMKGMNYKDICDRYREIHSVHLSKYVEKQTEKFLLLCSNI